MSTNQPSLDDILAEVRSRKQAGAQAPKIKAEPGLDDYPLSVAKRESAPEPSKASLWPPTISEPQAPPEQPTPSDFQEDLVVAPSTDVQEAPSAIEATEPATDPVTDKTPGTLPMENLERFELEDEDMTAYQPTPQFEKKPLTVDNAPTQSYDKNLEEKTMVIPDDLSKRIADEEDHSERAEKMRAYFALNDTDQPNARPKAEEGRLVEYESVTDEETCTKFLSNRISITALRFALVFLFALLSCYLAVADVLSFPLPSLLGDAGQYGILICQLALGVFGGLFSLRELADGLVELVTFKSSTKSVASVGYLAAIVQCVAACFMTESSELVPLLLPISLLTLTALLAARLLFATARAKSFRLVSSALPKETATVIDEGSLQQHMTRLSSYENAVSVVGVSTSFLSDFFAHTHQPDPSGRVQKILAPILLPLALICGIAVGFTGTEFYGSITLIAAILVVSAPLAGGLSSASVFHCLNRRLFAKGAMVSGFDTVESIADTNGVVLDATDLFPTGTVTLHGVKTFSTHRIDESLLTVASVVHAAKSTYSKMFMEVIEGRTEILLPVESYVYEDGMGISAWIANRRVLVGNRELLINHGIEVPSRDYEERYDDEGRELMYLSMGGDLAAMFILCYAPNEDVRQGLQKLHQAGFDLFVKTCDSNITPQKIAKIYDLEPEMFRLLPGSCYKEVEEVIEPKDSMPATLAYTGGFGAFSAAIHACAAGKSALHLSRVLQWVSAIVSLAAILFLALTGSTLFNNAVLLVISLFFGLITWALPLLNNR